MNQNDTRVSALIILFFVAFLFYLYHTGKLPGVVKQVIIPPNTGGTDFPGQGGYNEQGQSFDVPNLQKQSLILDQFGRPITDNNGQPVYFQQMPYQIINSSGLEGFFNKLNTFDSVNGPILNYQYGNEQPLPVKVPGYQ
jgi:hypothetical protein